MNIKTQVLLRRFVRRVTALRIRSALGQFVRDHRKKRMALFTSGANELSTTLKEVTILESCPIWEGDKINFEFLIPAKDSHISFLNRNLVNLASQYGNHIRVNVLVSNESRDFVNIPSALQGKVNIVEENFFEAELNDLHKHIARFNESRWNWFKQQCLKTLFVSYSSVPVVILDADTLLTKPINFQSNSKALVLMGSDSHSHFHAPYSLHIKKYLGIDPIPINFTQHCQLQEPDKIHEIYSENVVGGLSKWLALGRVPFEFSPVCEYQTYAEYVRKNYPSQISLFSHTHHLSFLSSLNAETVYPKLLSVDDHLLGNCDDNCHLVTMLG
jgi:hypothetical protein